MHEDYGTLTYDDLYVGMYVYVLDEDGTEHVGVVVSLSGPPTNPLQYWKPLVDGKCDGLISILPKENDMYASYGAIMVDSTRDKIKSIRPYILGDTYKRQSGESKSKKGFLQ